MTGFARCALGLVAMGFICLLGLGMPAHGQLLDQLKGAVGGGQGSGGQSGGVLGGLGGGGLPSVGQASQSNTAGVLQYCIRNKFAGGADASSVKNSLMSKMTGSGQTTNDSGFQAGNKGILDTGGGQSFSLGGGGGIKEQATKKVCDLILEHAKSFL